MNREVFLCRNSFLRFLKWCQIVSAPTIENPGGVVPFELWPHLLTVITAFLTKRFISILKARQIGISYIVAAYCLWYAMFHRGANIMLLSKGEKEAYELLDKAKRVYKHLPPFLKIELDSKSMEKMSFPAMESKLQALPATETAGIGETASIVVGDEHEEHPYAEKNYTTIRPTIDTSGGQFISIFTVNKQKPQTLAKALWRGAPDNGFTNLFFGWDSVPRRDEAWYKSVKDSLTAQDLEGLTADLYMEQNYPSSAEEALRSTSTVSAFDHRVLDEMMGEVKNPIGDRIDGIDPKVVHIYEDFHLGNFYIAATDTSHGLGKDFAVTTLMNVKTGVIVADIIDSLIPPEELAYHSVKLLNHYKDPLWFIEANDYGGVTISTAQNLGYRRFGYQDDRKTKVGFHTNAATRNLLWGELLPAINNKQVKIYNKDGIKQFYDVIRNAEENGRIEAMQSRHDDYPMAVGICWLKKGEVKTGVEPMKPIESLTFGKEAVFR